MTKAEERHLSAVAGLGCLICLKMGYPDSPAEIHHIRTIQGERVIRNHAYVLPLCPTHHRLGGWGIAFHAGSREWQRIHGTEEMLLGEVNRKLGEESPYA